MLRRHLSAAGYESLLEAAQANDQEGAVDPDRFSANLSECLRDGLFRLVFVLDEVPSELTQLVTYLRAISSGLLVDLITVASYQVGDSQILLPQRVEPGSPTMGDGRGQQGVQAPPRGVEVQGADRFEALIENAPEENREELGKLAGWARSLETEGLARLSTYVGVQRTSLLPRLPAADAGLVTVYNDRRSAYVSVYRGVLERLAPQALREIERLIHPEVVGQGTTLPSTDDEVLAALTAAYREGGAGR